VTILGERRGLSPSETRHDCTVPEGINPSARRRRSLVAALLALVVAGPVLAQDAPLKVRFVDRDPITADRPGLFAKLRLRLEFENTADEPRWIVTTLDRETKLAARFTPSADADLPFFALRSADKDGKQVVLVGFLGEPRFTAVRLPAKSKIVVDPMELPADADAGEMDWAEAKSIDVLVGADKRRVPLDSWLNLPVTSSTGAIAGKDAKWSDLVRDENGSLHPKIPKDKVAAVEIEPLRKGRLAAQGYESRGQFYSQAERPKADAVGGWRLVARFRPVRSLKVDALAFSPDGSSLIASLQTFKVVGLDLKNGVEKLFPESVTARARFLAFTAEDHLLVKEETAGKRLQITDWTAGKEYRKHSKIMQRVSDSNFVSGPTGDLFGLPSDGAALVLELGRENPFRLVRGSAEEGYAYRTGVFSPDSKRFALSYEHPQKGGKVYVWDLIPGVGDKADSGLPPRDVFVDRQTGIHFLSFSAAGDILVGSGKQATGVRVWRLGADKESAIRFEGGIANVHALALSPDGKLAAISATPFSSEIPIPPLTLRDTTDGRTIVALSGLRAPISAVAFSRDGRQFAAGDPEGLVQVWTRE
jgi:hypothetical protein